MQTLLEMVQDVLADMISDEVTSINDSEEALTVARMFRRVYYELAAHMDLPENEAMFNLTASGSTLQPVLMTRPEDVRSIEWVRYDKATAENTDLQYSKITYVTLKDFVDSMSLLEQSADNIGSMTVTVGDSSFTFLYENDRHPDYYTTIDDDTYIFNAYDHTLESTLSASRTLVLGTKSLPFTLSDTFVPAMDEQHQPLLVAEVAKRAFDLLKDRIPDTVNRTARRLKVSAQRTKRGADVKFVDTLPNYGRRK